MKINKKTISGMGGFFMGLANSIFGAGGGIIAVPLLKKSGLSQKEAHANAIAVILPVSILSAVLYIIKDKVQISDASPYILTGMAGAVLGTVFLKKISPVLLKKVFGFFIIYAGIRLLLR